MKIHYSPHTDSLLVNFHLCSLEVVVVEKVAILAWMQLIGQKLDEMIIEFKLAAHLMPQMVHAVEELEEYLGAISCVTCWIMSAALAKHVTKWYPLFLNQHLETFKSAVVWIEHQLGQWAELCCSVPAIRAMNQDIVLFIRYGIEYLVSACQ